MTSLTADPSAVAGKLEKALPKRIEQLTAAYLAPDKLALDERALRLAAAELARAQLEVELGLTDPRAFHMAGYGPDVSRKRVVLIRNRLAAAQSIRNQLAPAPEPPEESKHAAGATP